MFNLRQELNEQQYQAAAHVNGPLLVIAGAGSGKTRVITYRIANLVENHRVNPRRILAVTFTNKAAKEMRDRVVKLLEGRGEDCWVSTFHATCAKLLRMYGELININPKFTIYDDSDQKTMVGRCIKDLNHDDKTFPPRAIQHEINRSKQEGRGPEEYPASDFYRTQVKEIFALYEKRMFASSALDFGDLLYRTVRGIQTNEEFRRQLQHRFDYILVDEFQDTNTIQLEIVRNFSVRLGNICVVGDDDQSIYSWRGAEIRNILGFDKVFPGTVRVMLDRNYRSTANILAASHAVAAQLLERHPKKLWTDGAPGEKILYVEAEDEREEARLVARAVKDLRQDGIGLGEQAVFYRINAQSRVFEEVFRTMGIPYRVVGGMRFYERAEVKDVLSFLRLVQNPGDQAAFLRVVNVPTRGIGKTTVERLAAFAAEKEMSLFEAVARAHETDLGVAASTKLQAFCEMVEKWRAEIDQGPHHLAERVLEDTGYLAALKQDSSVEAESRTENLKELLGSIEAFERESETPTLDMFLELITLQSDVDQANFDGEEVTLMTVHSAKGLEFEAVFVTGMEQGMFPYIRGEGGMRDEPSHDEMEEERRLCYVAMTRAKKRLTLTAARERTIFGQSRFKPRSIFLRDVPAELLLDITAARPQVSAVASSSSSRPSTAFAFRPRPSSSSLSKPLPKKPPVDGGTWVDPSFDQRSQGEALSPGAQVRHARYGVGKVVSIDHGERIKVEVDFPGFGRKTIIAEYLEIG
jgi:DNA helicase-2/ATP-dependent DNA helicase PcrA